MVQLCIFFCSIWLVRSNEELRRTHNALQAIADVHLLVGVSDCHDDPGRSSELYEGYFRERQYGLATQTLVPWLGDQLIILLVNLLLGGVVAMVLFGVVRRLPRTWWIWGAGVSIVFLIFFIMIAPVFIFPLLNKYTVLEDPRITQPI